MTTAALEIALIAADAHRDSAVLQRWLADPHAAFWGMADLDVQTVAGYIGDITADPWQDAWLGLIDGAPAFYVETYDPARVLLDGIHDVSPGDLGMHVLISAPTDEPRHGFTDAVFATVMAWCFDERGARRVVVEPDVRNDRVRRKNMRAGFTELREVAVADGGGIKTAMLSVCTRAGFAASALAPAATSQSETALSRSSIEGHA